MPGHSPSVLAIVVATACSLPLAAQCSSVWESSGGVPGVDARVAALTTWDPDGAGPITPLLVVGGSFTIAGAQGANRIATYDPAIGTWASLFLGLDGPVNALATLANGELVVGGSFGGAYGTVCPAIVRWNGSSWAPLGTGLYVCNALLALPGGDLIATGIFSTAGGVPANGIARWNGAAWLPLGSGLAGSFPVGNALARLPNGDIVVAGDFASAGGTPANHIARWDGSSWAAMPGLPNLPITDLAVLPNGDLIANPGGGINGSGALWRWNGTAWSSFATLGGFYSTTTSLNVVDNGDLVVGGSFSGIGGVTAANLARWDGATWHAVGTATNPPYPNATTLLPGGDLIVGGQFSAIGPLVARSVARWNGSQWSALGGGPGVPIAAQTWLADGRHIVATTDARVLRRDGATWTALGSALPGTIRDVRVLANGDLVAAGYWTIYSPAPTARLLRWDGLGWQPFAGPLTNSSGTLPIVNALLPLPNGDVVAGGIFTNAGGQLANNVAIWNGSSWTPLQQGVQGQVLALARLPDGDLVVGGDFFTASGSGGTWLGGTAAPGRRSVRAFPARSGRAR